MALRMGQLRWTRINRNTEQSDKIAYDGSFAIITRRETGDPLNPYVYSFLPKGDNPEAGLDLLELKLRLAGCDLL